MSSRQHGFRSSRRPANVGGSGNIFASIFQLDIVMKNGEARNRQLLVCFFVKLGRSAYLPASAGDDGKFKI